MGIVAGLVVIVAVIVVLQFGAKLFLRKTPYQREQERLATRREELEDLQKEDLLARKRERENRQ